MAKPVFCHMMERDVPLFAAFVLSQPPEVWDKWVFDFHVGQSHLEGTTSDPIALAMSLATSRLRIDAVGFRGGFPTIFEVKPYARLSAYGQVKAYQMFYESQYGTRANMGIITDKTNPNIQWLCAREGIELHIVKPATQDQMVKAAYLVKACCDQLVRIPETSYHSRG